MIEGMEADDVIATLARAADERGLDVVICTADKDARQLLNDHIRIFNLRKQGVLDVEGLKADWGVRPDQVVDMLALTGDTSDNVPGVPGIGLKTAVAACSRSSTRSKGSWRTSTRSRRQAEGEPHRLRRDRQAGRRLITLRGRRADRHSTGRRFKSTAPTSRPSRRSASSAASTDSWTEIV